MQWLGIVAWIQTKVEIAILILNRLRRRVLLPFAHSGGRDMILLTNGQWIDHVRSIPESMISAIYTAEKHTLLQPSAGRTVRWPWLSVHTDSLDMSEFFQGLRISSGLTVSRDKALMLYVHQKGILPVGDLYIVNRDGEEEIVRADGAPTTEETLRRVDSVNHIK